MTRPPRDALRQEILAVARRRFSEIGYQATSLQTVADEVGCSKGALLYHFRSKAAIVEALVAPLLHDLDGMADRLDGVPEDRVRPHCVELGVALVIRHREALAMLGGLEGLEELADLTAWADQRTDALRALLTGPDPDPADRVAALAFERGLLAACMRLGDLDDRTLTTALLEVGARLTRLDPAGLTPVELGPADPAHRPEQRPR